ncbi:MAG: cation diffusion facilitator family transporter [Bacteroidales bacterium]|nr:cation diffusion facilitator family transporter [Bacteroidales bacterium]
MDREKLIVNASWISIGGNAILSLMMIITGLVAGSLAVVANGIDSATDIVASVVTLFAAYLMTRPPDLKYVYGYERADNIASKVLAFIIFFAGVQLAISSIQGLTGKIPKELPSILAVYITVAAAAGKVLLAWYLWMTGKKTGSMMLQSNARNMMNDIIISLAVLLGLFFTFILKLPLLDAVTALLVSFWIMYVAFRIFRESSMELMDGVKDSGLYVKVFNAISKIEGVYHPHRTRIRKIGYQYVVAVDVEVDGDIPVSKAHQLAHLVEEQIRKELVDVYDVLIHTEPIGDDNRNEVFGIDEDNLRKLKKKENKK